MSTFSFSLLFFFSLRPVFDICSPSDSRLRIGAPSPSSSRRTKILITRPAARTPSRPRPDPRRSTSTSLKHLLWSHRASFSSESSLASPRIGPSRFSVSDRADEDEDDASLRSLESLSVGCPWWDPKRRKQRRGKRSLGAQPPVRSFSPFVDPLPCELHIVSFKVPQPLKYSQQPNGEPRFALLLQRKSWDSSYCKKGRSQWKTLADEPVNLANMFRNLSVVNVKATPLNLVHDDTVILGYPEQLSDVARDGNVLVSLMEIQAYKLDLGRYRDFRECPRLLRTFEPCVIEMESGAQFGILGS